MRYFLDLYSPETFEAFSASDRSVTGFALRWKSLAQQVQVGDRLLCYITKVSRWAGVLEVVSPAFQDDTPRFTAHEDPYVIRFKVKPLVWLDLVHALPIYEDFIWGSLSFTQAHQKHTTTWTGILRSSLRPIDSGDAALLETELRKQAETLNQFPLSLEEQKKLKSHTIRVNDDKQVTVSIPEESEPEAHQADNSPGRESIRIQAAIAWIGEQMGMQIWLPRSDRSRVLEHWNPSQGILLDALPLSYDETTLRTIEQIDVLWIRRRTIVRAFEVEHTTSIYSGILRMADLMALQPNIDIKAHIVAPEDRREKVFQEITRPVFTLLEKGPLAESCTFIPYHSVVELQAERNLSHLRDSVLDRYCEKADQEDI